MAFLISINQTIEIYHWFDRYLYITFVYNLKLKIMSIEIKNQKIREYEYNNLLTEENHLKVAKAQYILKVYDLWLQEKVTFDFFKEELNK